MEPILGHNAGLPTQSITTKYRHKLTQRITDELHSPAFRKSAKNDPLQEHRNRKLTLVNLICIIVTFKTAIQRELYTFFKALANSEFNIRQVTKGAFSQARAKLTPGPFSGWTNLLLTLFMSKLTTIPGRVFACWPLMEPDWSYPTIPPLLTNLDSITLALTPTRPNRWLWLRYSMMPEVGRFSRTLVIESSGWS